MTRIRPLFVCAWTSLIPLALVPFPARPDEFHLSKTTNESGVQVFTGRGIVQKIQAEEGTVVIRHEAISNYMAAMTMPFKVKEPDLLSILQAGDEIAFQLHVSDSESWIDGLNKTGVGQVSQENGSASAPVRPAPEVNPLLDIPFTNELGQAVTLSDFRGQALALTFFYTRCPLPDYCPRLSKNFAEASRILKQATNAPANWHLLSVSFDPEFDTPAMLKAYGASYEYDPSHWSFLTGSRDNIAKLLKASGVTFEPDSGTINHNFRTLIIDANSQLQMVFPTSGNLSDQIADQLIKAATVTNQPPN